MSGNTGPVEEGRWTESFDKTGQTLQLESVGQPIDQEPPKNDFFILEDFWPFFKLLEILGLFPCSKEINKKGTVQLKPIRWWIPIMKVLGFYTLLILSVIILHGHLKSSNNDEVSDYDINFFSKIFLKNTTRAYVTGLSLTVYCVLNSGFVLAFIIKRKELCAIQELFSATPINNTAKKITKKIIKPWIYIFLIVALGLIFIVFFLLYVYLPLLQELLTTSETIVIITKAFLDVMIFLYFGVLIHLNAVILYLQLTCNIMNLIREIDPDSMTFGTILENTANLMRKVNLISSFLSPQCFHLVLYHIIMIIVLVFFFIDFHLDGTSQFSPTLYVFIGAMISNSILILCIFNWQSYDVKQRLS